MLNIVFTSCPRGLANSDKDDMVIPSNISEKKLLKKVPAFLQNTKCEFSSVDIFPRNKHMQHNYITYNHNSKILRYTFDPKCEFCITIIVGLTVCPGSSDPT